MAKRVVLLGAGGQARDALDVFEACNRARPGYWQLVGFVSELEADHGREVNGLPVLGGFEWFSENRDLRVICSIGEPAVRQRVVARALGLGLEFVTVVHPRAEVTERVQLGAGVIVSAGVVMTNSIEIGDHVILNLGTTVAHDARIGEYCTLAPGVNLPGHVTLGTGCDIGTGAVVLPGITVGEWSIIGAGATVIADLPANTTAVGVPAKVIKTRPPGWWQSV